MKYEKLLQETYGCRRKEKKETLKERYRTKGTQKINKRTVSICFIVLKGIRIFSSKQYLLF
jgi:hypothetical protein